MKPESSSKFEGGTSQVKGSRNSTYTWFILSHSTIISTKHFSSSGCLDYEALLQLLQRRGRWTQCVLVGYFKHQFVLPQNYCTHVGLIPASHHPPLLFLPFTLPCWLRQTCNTESLRADICIKTILFAYMHIYSMCIEWASQLPSRKRKDPLILGGVEGVREQWGMWLAVERDYSAGVAPWQPQEAPQCNYNSSTHQNTEVRTLS